MFRTTLTVDGMMCPMCESHINDVVRKTVGSCSVKSSFKKGITTIETEAPVDIPVLSKKIAETGYAVKDAKTEEFEKKKGFFASLFG